jgi:hypothetical protein
MRDEEKKSFIASTLCSKLSLINLATGWKFYKDFCSLLMEKIS